MKRMWIGAGLLGILLAAGLLIGTMLEARLTPEADRLRQAGDWALAGNWEKAEALTGSVRAHWENHLWIAEMLATHENLEQIQTSFAQLPSYAGTDGAAYSAICTALAQQLEALGQAHSCSWKNLL